MKATFASFNAQPRFNVVLPPLWRSAARLKTPLLRLAGAADTLIAEKAEAKSARHYGADYVVVPGAGHNVMMEKSCRETAVTIHNWLAERG